MKKPKPSINIHVDLANPGQFFACCGLLELADRLWPGAEGWFDRKGVSFYVATPSGAHALDDLLDAIKQCSVTNTMSEAQRQRRKELAGMKKKELAAKSLDVEKKILDKLWRESPVVFGPPFDFRIDWFLDEDADGARFKTWAGQQSVIDITLNMKEAIMDGLDCEKGAENWLRHSTEKEAVPFNFDSNLGPQGSSLDVGYSLDALNMTTRKRPMIELGAFVGLQRFRPLQIGNQNLYRYRVWHEPLPLQIASLAACTLLPLSTATDFEFRLLYRTKYLKSFLPATKIGGHP